MRLDVKKYPLEHLNQEQLRNNRVDVDTVSDYYNRWPIVTV